MKYDQKADTVTFESTGRVTGRVWDAIGIEQTRLEPTYGYDGTWGEVMRDPLSDDERCELANFMIGLWTRYRDQSGAPA